MKVAPVFFNFRTLNVWRPEVKNLMVHTHEVLNGERSLYVPADLNFYSHLGEKPYTTEELLSALADQSLRRFRFHRHSDFNVALDGVVAGAYKATPTAWVLTLRGSLVGREARDCVEADVVCFYETGDYGCTGRGFGLIPSLPLAQLGY